ncbi:MAG TPA: OmpA family protein [Arenibaculum sp.]|nr:OmpA family protein [Arenibaculum sp.]
MFTTRSARILIAGLLVTAAQPALAENVRMFDHVPTVDDLRSVVAPERPPGIRTRGIEIVGSVGAAARRTAPNHIPAAARFEPAAEPVPAAQPAATRPDPAPSPEPAPASLPERDAAPAPEPGVFGFRINFGFNSAEIPADAMPFVDTVAALMQEEPDIMLIVEGHTDAVGSDGYNLDLSKRRAAAVGAYLVETGQVDLARVVIRGKGESEPLTTDPYDGVNRRVQFLRAR